MALGLLWMLGWGGTLQAAPHIVDDQGRTEVFERPPQRIVSLLPSLAEMVCELGHCQRLVGVDRYTQWPPELKNRRQVGGGLDPHIEQIVALQPEVVLLATSARAADRLRRLGLKVLAFEPQTYAQTQAVMLKLGQLLGVSNAPKIWQNLESGIASAALVIPPRAHGMRVYFEVGPEPYAAGEASFIGELLKRLGLKNIVPPTLGTFPKLNPEFVVRADPELILISEKNSSSLRQRPGWGGIHALQAQRVCSFSPEQSDVLVRPGPRLPEAANLIAQCLVQHATQPATPPATSASLPRRAP